MCVYATPETLSPADHRDREHDGQDRERPFRVQHQGPLSRRQVSLSIFKCDLCAPPQQSSCMEPFPVPPVLIQLLETHEVGVNKLVN